MRILMILTLLASLSLCNAIVDSADAVDAALLTSKIAAAVEDVRNLFHGNRPLEPLSSIPHTYDEMFAQSSFMSSMGIASLLPGLEAVGLSMPILQATAAEMAATNSPRVLKFRATSNVDFLRNESTKETKSSVNTLLGFFPVNTTQVVESYRLHYKVRYEIETVISNPIDIRLQQRLAHIETSMDVYSEAGKSPLPLPRTHTEVSLEPILRLVEAIGAFGNGSTALRQSVLAGRGANLETGAGQTAAPVCIPSSTSEGVPQCAPLGDFVGHYVTIDRSVPHSTPTNNAETKSIAQDMQLVGEFGEKVADSMETVAAAVKLRVAGVDFHPSVAAMQAVVSDAPRDASVDEGASVKDCGALTTAEAISDSSCKVEGTTMTRQEAGVLLAKFAADVGTAIEDTNNEVEEMRLQLLDSAPARNLGRFGWQTTGGVFADPAVVRLTIGARLLRTGAAATVAAHRDLRDLLYTHVAQAVGQHVSAADVIDYVVGLGSEKYLPAMRPKSFVFAIRKAGDTGSEAVPQAAAASAAVVPVEEEDAEGPAAAEGFLSLEWVRTSGKRRSLPILTARQPVVGTNGGSPDFYVSLTDGISAKLKAAKAAVHGFVVPNFGGDTEKAMRLSASTRPFGGMVLLVGGVEPSEDGPRLVPTAGVVLRHNDLVHLPLILQPMPSPGAFQKALRGISENMQAFARTFRAMQLRQSVLAVAAVPLTPQIEQALNVPTGALSKELELTNKVMELLVDKSMPTGLLAYDPAVHGVANVSAAAAAAAVAVAAVNKSVEGVLKQMEAIADARAEPPIPVPVPSGYGYRYYPPMAPMSAVAPQMPPMDYSGGGNGTSSGSSPDVIDPPSSSLQGSSAMVIPAGGVSLPALMKLPTILDARFLASPAADELRPTLLKVGTSWQLKSPESFLDRNAKLAPVGDSRRSSMTREALSLLDLLTNSGALPLVGAQVHFVMGTTHNFAESVLATVVDYDRNVLEDVADAYGILLEVLSGLDRKKLLVGQSA